MKENFKIGSGSLLFSLQEIKDEFVRRLQIDKEEIIVRRLKELGISIDLKKEDRKRFKSLAREVRGKEETIYYNDGSEQGLRVITFVAKQEPFNISKSSIEVNIDYY